jgi:hypothetical protein
VHRQEVQRRRRRQLLWYGLGFLAVQGVLALGLEAGWTSVRDPQFAACEQLVAARRAEAPLRPLFLAMGSSRTQQALCAAKLNHPEDPRAPLVVNCSFPSSGPMTHQVMLRRLLAAGHIPSRVFLEVLPMSLSARDGPPIEERQDSASRFTAGEVSLLWPYYAQRYRLLLPWALSRLLPANRAQAELREAIGIDAPPGQGKSVGGGDAYGWVACTSEFPTAQVEAFTRKSLEHYHSALTQPALAPGAVRAVRDLVMLCQERHIAIEIFVPPEGSAFRSYASAVEECHMNALRGLARELGVNLTDGRCWVDDIGFYDGHHANWKGADQFTERFAREVLLPHLPTQPSPSNTVLTRSDRVPARP